MARPEPAGALHVVDRGAGGPALVFLHYFAGSSSAWTPVIDRLADRNRCIAPDLRGFGLSPAPPNEWSVDLAADDVESLVRERDVGNFILVGHSMGGKIALALAARRLDNLLGLLLLAPSPPTPEPMEEEQRAKLLRSRGEHDAAQTTLRGITRRALKPETFERCVADNLATSPEAWGWWLERGSREDVSATVGCLALPSLVIVGEKDPVLSRQVMDRCVLPTLAQARLLVVTGAGHLLPLEAPGEIADHFGTFVSGFPGPPFGSATEL